MILNEPTADELKLMEERGFRLNKMGVYQRDLPGDWTVIISPRRGKRDDTIWWASLNYRCVIKDHFRGCDNPPDTADRVFAKWWTWFND